MIITTIMLSVAIIQLKRLNFLFAIAFFLFFGFFDCLFWGATLKKVPHGEFTFPGLVFPLNFDSFEFPSIRCLVHPHSRSRSPHSHSLLDLGQAPRRSIRRIPPIPPHRSHANCKRSGRRCRYQTCSTWCRFGRSLDFANRWSGRTRGLDGSQGEATRGFDRNYFTSFTHLRFVSFNPSRFDIF